jgi:transposase
MKQGRFSPEVRERAVAMTLESRVEGQSLWSAIESVAAKIGCAPQTLNEWVKQHQRDSGVREGPTTADKQRVAELERENRELRKANEILKLASAFFAQAELDRRLK